jgi:CRISPR-associated protein Csb1
MSAQLSHSLLASIVAGRAAAFRCITDYQPAGGVGDKVFPPTYEGGKYAVEQRVVEEGEIVDCVLLDSVPSQANRMELALLEAWRSGRIAIPVVSVRFEDPRLKKGFAVTSLEAPHRVADALLRDSLLDGIMFRQSALGRLLDTADTRNATGLFRLNPTALIFGLWDSTGPRGGGGAKFQRALVSEMVGYQVQAGVKTSSRLDPAQIMLGAGPLYERAGVQLGAPGWTTDAEKAIKDKGQPRKLGKDGKPSNANHGNVTPGITSGGFTISYARQTTVLSLAALRRLRFPLGAGADSDANVDLVARTTLTALGLLGATLAREEGADLRSRCQLFPTQEFQWELMATPGQTPQTYSLTGEQAESLLQECVAAARAAGLPWEDELRLTPSEDLLQLVAKSQELAAGQVEGDA